MQVLSEREVIMVSGGTIFESAGAMFAELVGVSFGEMLLVASAMCGAVVIIAIYGAVLHGEFGWR